MFGMILRGTARFRASKSALVTNPEKQTKAFGKAFQQGWHHQGLLVYQPSAVSVDALVPVTHHVGSTTAWE